MRATVMMFVLAASVASAPLAAKAQGAPAGKDQQSSPAPNKPDAKPKNEGRTGSLSPDEARRAARARERAALAASKVTAGSDDREKEAAAPSATSRDTAPSQVAVARVSTPKNVPHVSKRTASRAAVRRLARNDLSRRRRALAGNFGHSLSVGDVVPSSVPLYPLPFGYGQPPRVAFVGSGYGASPGPFGYRPAPSPYLPAYP